MPGKNIRKNYGKDCYYHVYNRGVNKRPIFIDDQDYAYFLSLLKRYLSKHPAKDKKGREYPWYANEVELITFCLMPNHFHLLLFQHSPEGITHLLRAVMSSYSMYFNERHKRVGPLFQNRFEASLVQDDGYLMHISRYIHLNPKNYKYWKFSSLPYYLNRQHAEWLNAHAVMQGFKNTRDYLRFLEDYEENKNILKELEPTLANF